MSSVATDRDVVPSRWEFVEGWGMAVGAHERVYRPRSVEELRNLLLQAAREGVSLGPRGSGCSYGDASVNRSGHAVELSALRRILSFDEQTGIIDLEAGATIEHLWKFVLPRGFWPKVVSGTMYPTIGGAAAMNIHGKNNFAVGTFGDAILDFDILLPNGDLRRCSREENADLFHAAIGGLGMLGFLVRARLRTTRVHSGELEVTGVSTRNLRETMEYFEAHRRTSDYLVGWVDCFASGDDLGRGLIHDARYLEPGEDPEPERTLSIAHQELPPSILGFPKSEVWRILRLLNHDPGMRLVNWAKFHAGRLEGMGEPYRQPHAAFAFLLDYVPNWKWAYGRRDGRGLIQYQAFVPHETALETYEALLARSQAAGHVPYLGVFKRHRPDPFWLTHAVDGWSFALDYKVTPENRESLWRHARAMSDLVLAAGGKFYFAKDLVVGPGDARAFFPPERLDRFLALKRELDPATLLQTNLWRRVFAPLAEERLRSSGSPA